MNATKRIYWRNNDKAINHIYFWSENNKLMVRWPTDSDESAIKSSHNELKSKEQIDKFLENHCIKCDEKGVALS